MNHSQSIAMSQYTEQELREVSDQIEMRERERESERERMRERESEIERE